MTSAADRLNVLWPDTKPGNEGVTKVGSWYGTHAVASIQRVPDTSDEGSPGVPPHARTAIRPTYLASPWWRSPGADDFAVTTSMRPGTSGRPLASYDDPLASLDWPSPPMYRI